MGYSGFNYLIITIITIFLFSMFREKPKPTYDPFDDLFQVDTRQFVRDNCDTIPAGCGYYNLAKIENDFAVYYQIYRFGSSNIEAKTFVFWIDTFLMSMENDYPNFLDTLPISASRINRLEEIIQNFNFSVDSITKGKVKIVSHNKADTFLLGVHTYLERYEPRPVYVRQLGVFRAAPINPPQKIKRYIERYYRECYQFDEVVVE